MNHIYKLEYCLVLFVTSCSIRMQLPFDIMLFYMKGILDLLMVLFSVLVPTFWKVVPFIFIVFGLSTMLWLNQNNLTSEWFWNYHWSCFCSRSSWAPPVLWSLHKSNTYIFHQTSNRGPALLLHAYLLIKSTPLQFTNNPSFSYSATLLSFNCLTLIDYNIFVIQLQEVISKNAPTKRG